jgi:hypothetical protein
LAVTVVVAAPVSLTVAAFPPPPVIVPDILNVVWVAKLAVTFAVVTVTF